MPPWTDPHIRHFIVQSNIVYYIINIAKDAKNDSLDSQSQHKIVLEVTGSAILQVYRLMTSATCAQSEGRLMVEPTKFSTLLKNQSSIGVSFTKLRMPVTLIEE